ncbi:PREDICTED: probable glutathione S-transferase [Ipomoea nil]|uniref:probable glutathione S-transferase n=1 Tax=Ipomoea nil TaxID=35883 RepID=UPI0009019924|nr:PREDICTED: probable glutathione S-transferase [Ipomoea nil]
MAEEVKLYRTWSSPYGLRVVWALNIKHIQYETILEDLTNKSHHLLRYNPVHKKIPVLLHNGKPICESLVILEYIEDTWHNTPLLPQHPLDRAHLRFWAKFCEDKLLPSIRSSYFMKGKEQEEGVVQALDNLKLIEEQLNGGKRFFGGDNIGFLDIVLGWLANLPSVFEEITGLKLIDAEKFPVLSEWMHNFYNHPAILDHWPPRDKMITKFQAIFNAIEANK